MRRVATMNNRKLSQFLFLNIRKMLIWRRHSRNIDIIAPRQNIGGRGGLLFHCPSSSFSDNFSISKSRENSTTTPTGYEKGQQSLYKVSRTAGRYKRGKLQTQMLRDSSGFDLFGANRYVQKVQKLHLSVCECTSHCRFAAIGRR